MRYKIILIIIFFVISFVLLSPLIRTEKISPPQFDKNEMKTLYSDALKYCNKQDLRATGEVLGCHFDYMEKRNSQLRQDYEKIRNYCYAVSDTTFDTWKCVDNVILK